MYNNQLIDKTSVEIIGILQDNARTPNAEIARRVGLTTSAVQDRIKKMEARGILRGFTALVEPSALGLTLTAFIGVRISPHNLAPLVGPALAATPGVEEVFRLAGEECFLVKVRCQHTAGLETVLERIISIDGVVATRTTIALGAVAEASGAIIKSHPTPTEEGERT